MTHDSAIRGNVVDSWSAAARSPVSRVDADGLVQAARRGESSAARALWTAQAPGLLRAAIALGIQPADAADVVQETLMAAFRSLDRFDPHKGAFSTWTHAILVRRCSNWRRARSHVAKLLAGLRQEPPGHTPAAEAVEAKLTLESLVRGLSRSQRRVWALVEVAGLSGKQAADALGLREATVRSHLRHARAAMRRAAEKDGTA